MNLHTSVSQTLEIILNVLGLNTGGGNPTKSSKPMLHEDIFIESSLHLAVLYQ